MNKYVLHDIRLILCGVLFIMGLIACMFAGLRFISSYACEVQTEDFTHRYSYFTGCQIQVDGKWVPWKNYRPVD